MCWAARTTAREDAESAQQSGRFGAMRGMDSKPTDNMDGIVASLVAEDQALGAEEAVLRERLTAVTSRRRNLQRAILTLRGNATSKPDSKPRLTRDLVQSAALRAIEAGPKNYDQLKNAVLAEAREAGVVGTGVHLILQQVVNDPQFEQVDGLFRKKRSAPTAS